MPAMTIRNLSDETHRAIKARAAAHNRSAEAEVRAILEAAVSPEGGLGVGSLLATIGKELDGVDLDVDRQQVPREPPDLR